MYLVYILVSDVMLPRVESGEWARNSYQVRLTRAVGIFHFAHHFQNEHIHTNHTEGDN